MCTLLTPNIGNLADYGICLITKGIIPIIITIAIVMFVWGVVNFFIINAGEEAKRNKGKQFIIWGIIAFVVVISVWGMVRILGRTVGVNTRVIPRVVPNQNSLSPGGMGGAGNVDPNDPYPLPPDDTDTDPINPAPCYYTDEGCGDNPGP